MLWKQQVVGVAAIAFGVGCAAQAFAQESALSHFQANTSEPGFYGGIALRENAQDTAGVSLGRLEPHAVLCSNFRRLSAPDI